MVTVIVLNIIFLKKFIERRPTLRPFFYSGEYKSEPVTTIQFPEKIKKIRSASLWICTFLTSIYLFYNKRKEDIQNNIADETDEVNSLFDSKFSYDKYKEISRKTSVRNSPIRMGGDFTEYFISHINQNTDLLENNIMNISCEE